MDNEEHQHLEGLRRIYQKRLWKLEQQAAFQGTSTPPEVQIELDELQKKMVDMTTRLGLGNLPTSGGLPPTPPHDSMQLGPLSIDQVHEEKIDAVLTELRQVHEQLPQPLPKSRLDPQAINRCDERLEAISSLWQQIGYRALLGNDAKHTPAG
jgi:hypothetical protein